MITNRTPCPKVRCLVAAAALLAAAALAACSPQPGPMPNPEIAEAIAAATTEPMAATSEATRVETVQAEPTPEPTAAGQPAETVDSVQIFLVALGDEGKSGVEIGCGDSLVPVQRQVGPADDPLAAALGELLALEGRTYGEAGLYNALYQSDLSIESITREGSSVTVRLAGEHTLGGVCNIPRFEAQIRETVLQFAGIEEVAVFLNGVPMDEALSLKG